MELKQIKELMAAMGRCGVTKVVVKREGEFEVQLERHEGGQVVYAHPPEERVLHPLPSTRPVEPLFTSAQETGASREGKFITSPMVGTFYTTPSPDDPPFVKAGDRVDADTVVCIVEAMKVMNEIKAGVAGTIVEALITNGHPVEFGTKLYRIE